MATKSNESLSAGWAISVCLLIGTLCIFIWRRHATSSELALSTANHDPDASLPTRKGVYLQEIDLNRTEADTDIDIIAIHGLDTKSPDTWTWKDPRDPNNKRKWVNWLGPGMLPTSVDRVRIFTCDWPADLLVPSDLIQKTIEEYALLLLEGIESALFTCDTRPQDRPILFIASCLGGLILIKALVHADDRRNRYYCLRKATRGIIFLATPFRGTSFQDVAAWAEVGLKAKASTQGRNVSRLLDSVKESTFQLEQSVGEFTLLCRDNDNPCEVFSFFELGTTSLPHKALPWLPRWFHQKKQLVNRSSATLDIVIDPLSLERPHSLMNKFEHPKCPDYEKVVSRIRSMTKSIRAGTPLEQADKLIRDKHYTMDRLKIERLSGKLLPIDQCYINLAIMNKSGQKDCLSGINGHSTTSPFWKQVELAAMFNKREVVAGAPIHPRRISIRGRAGVGKSTLCKKIVYDFTYGIETDLHRLWKKLFDRILWIPLRRLKIQPVEGWSLESLFYHEYFKNGGEDKGRRLAEVLSQALLGPSAGRTLFLLDGLDEVARAWGYNDYRTGVLLELLNQPAVIITSRPSAILPDGVHKTDFEVETIGFYPDQVADYIRNTFTEQETVDEIRSFLEAHWLIQDLVRIPIQLDALCYTWDDLELGDIPNTTTRIYEEIELKLWKKDIVRLEKRHDDKMLLVCDLQTIDRSNIERFAKDEMFFLECLAFTGLHNHVMDFTSKHLKDISNRFTPNLLPNKSLPSLSFLRTSDPLSEYHYQEYHFIHFTFQEYFAARYFARQWKDPEGQLQIFTLGSNNAGTRSRPIEFLRGKKYTARYEIFWRFVAGLLDASGQSSEFIRTIEEEPLDLLGPTHQRLVMYCLSETLGDLPLRETLEERLAQWLLFECKLNEPTTKTLASEMEFPTEALKTVLLDKSHNFQAVILQSLSCRASVSQESVEVVATHLVDKDRLVRATAGRTLSMCTALPGGVLKLMTAQLDDEDPSVKSSAVWSLSNHTALPNEVLQAIAARLDDKDEIVRYNAMFILKKRAYIPDWLLKALAARLDDKDRDMRLTASEILGTRAMLPDEVLEVVTARLSDKDQDMRQIATTALMRAALPDYVLEAMVAQLSDEDLPVYWSAVMALGRRAALPDEALKIMAARLSDKRVPVRTVAIKSFSMCAALPDWVLKVMTAQLDDQDPLVRLDVIEALFTWVARSDEVLKAVASRLGDESLGVRWVATEALSTRVTLPDQVIRALAARLSSEECPHLRTFVIQRLSRYIKLPDEAHRAIVARLKDEDGLVREAAVEAICTRATLPNLMLEAVAVRLVDGNSNMRGAAIEALCRRATLPDEILKAVAAQLDDEDQFVRQAVVNALTHKREHLHRLLCTKELITSLYRACLEQSFAKQVSWYFENGYCYINGPGGIRKISLDIGENEIREWISQARPAGFPSISTGENLPEV